MVSKEVVHYIEVEGIEKLYKKMEKCFLLVDEMSDRLIQGDLLNELELAQFMDRATGIYAKLQPIVGALEAYKENSEFNAEVKGYGELEKVRTQDNSIVKSKARASVNELRTYYSDFNNYAISAEKIIVMCQSRLKRLVVEGGARGVYRTGETEVTKDPREEIVVDLKNMETSSGGSVEWRS